MLIFLVLFFFSYYIILKHN